MKILIVYAHPNPGSFNHAILQTLNEGLLTAGHEVRIKDLYTEGFDPMLDRARLAAMSQGEIADDVIREQQALSWADGLVFIYPLWWFDRPAILKGWFDRVFTNGFAFEYTRDGLKGLLAHEKALVIVTTGGGVDDYAMMSASDHLIRPTTDGTLAFCGVTNIIDKVFYSVPIVSPDERKAMLEEVRELAAGF